MASSPFDPDPEQRVEYLYNTINSTISKDQWRAWADKVDPKCPPEAPFRTDKKVSGGDQNECVETPDNCPYGTRAFGKDKCLSEQDPRVSWGEGGRRGAPGGPNAPGTRPFGGGGPTVGPNGEYPYFGPEGVYGNEYVGGDYGLSSMYQGLLGNRQKSQAFLAAQTEGLQQQMEGQVQAIMASMPPGGQRDRAIQQLRENHQANLGQLRQGLLTSSMGGLQSLYGTQLADAAQRYGIDVGSATSRYGIDVGRQNVLDQLGLGWGELGEKGREFDLGFGEGQRQFNVGQGNWEKDFGFKGQQFDWQKEWAKQQRQDQRRSGLSSLISGLTGSLLGGGNEEEDKGGKTGGGGSWWKKALGIGASVAPLIFSDVRTKEDVKPFEGGLSEILKLNPQEATYNGKAGTPKGEKIISVMAQEMEKVLPEGVKTVQTDLPDTKMISPLTILMTSVNALKEVDHRLSKLEKKRGRN